MTTPSLSRPRPRRPKLWLTGTVALSLLAGAQALAPANAAATDDGGWCFRVVNGSVVFDNDCEGAGETIVIVDKKPEPNRPPSGPGHDGSIGGEAGRQEAGPRGGGVHGGAIPKKQEAPKPAKLREPCRRYAHNIAKFYREERAISRGELGFWDWFTGGGIETTQFEATKKAWVRDGCPGPVPTEKD